MFADVQERNTLLSLCPLLEWLAAVPTGWKRNEKTQLRIALYWTPRRTDLNSHFYVFCSFFVSIFNVVNRILHVYVDSLQKFKLSPSFMDIHLHAFKLSWVVALEVPLVTIMAAISMLFLSCCCEDNCGSLRLDGDTSGPAQESAGNLVLLFSRA